MGRGLCCERCGSGLVVSPSPGSRHLRCPACGTVYSLTAQTPATPTGVRPEPSHEAGSCDTYELAPFLADPLRVPTQASRDAASLVPPVETSTWELLRESTLGTSRLQGLSLCLVVLSAIDLLITFSLLSRSHTFYEANPVAQWFFHRWDMRGMVLFKFTVIGSAIAMGEIIERRRPGWGRLILGIGCLGATAVIYQGLRLHLAHH